MSATDSSKKEKMHFDVPALTRLIRAVGPSMAAFNYQAGGSNE
jgi:hypothetical protein